MSLRHQWGKATYADHVYLQFLGVRKCDRSEEASKLHVSASINKMKEDMLFVYQALDEDAGMHVHVEYRHQRRLNLLVCRGNASLLAPPRMRLTPSCSC